MLEYIDRYIIENKFGTFCPRAVFFDMDGVLFDSMPYHSAAWVGVMTEMGIPFTVEDAYMNEGRTGKATINDFFLRYKNRKATDSELCDIYRRKTEWFNRISDVSLIPGIKQIIDRLKADGVDIYLVTGSGQRTLLDTLNIWFPGIFNPDHVVSAYDVVNGKPDPEPYLCALKRSGVGRNEVFVVENAPLGVRSSVAAGLFTVAVNTGPLDLAVLEAECRNSGVVLPDMWAVWDSYDILMGERCR